MRRAILPLAITLLALASGCANRRGAWSFPCSSVVYRQLDEGLSGNQGSNLPPMQGPPAIAFMVVVLVLPLAVDLDILPVTGVHDLCLD